MGALLIVFSLINFPGGDHVRHLLRKDHFASCQKRYVPQKTAKQLRKIKSKILKLLCFFFVGEYTLCDIDNPGVDYVTEFCNVTCVEINFLIRPSSDVVLLPCRTKLQFGSTVARQEIYSDSDVVPESNQIQGLLEPRNNSPPNSPKERNLARTY